MSQSEISPAEQRRLRKAYLEERLQFVQKNFTNLERDKRKVPWLLLLVFLAIPAGIFKGWIVAFLTVAATLFTVGAAYYLLWGHRSEYVQKIQELQAELKRL